MKLAINSTYYSVRCLVCAHCNRQQQVSKLWRGVYSRRTVCASAFECQLTSPLALLKAVFVYCPLRKYGRAFAPPKFRPFGCNCIEQRWLARIVAVSALFNAACPSSAFIGRNPSASAWRHGQPKVRPSMASPWVLKNPAKPPHAFQRSRKAAAVIAFLFSLASSGNPQRLSSPKLPPSLAWRVRYHWQWPGVAPGVLGFVPWLHAGQAKVSAIGFNVQCSYHF